MLIIGFVGHIFAAKARAWAAFLIFGIILSQGFGMVGPATLWALNQAVIPSQIRATGFGFINFVRGVSVGLGNILAGLFLVDQVGILNTLLYTSVPAFVLGFIPLFYMLFYLDLSKVQAMPASASTPAGGEKTQSQQTSRVEEV